MNDTLNQALTLGLAWLAGGVLGAIFFGGLWWTVRRAMASAQSALWIFISLLLRMSIALAGFYFVADAQWQRLLACLVGFIMARALVTRLTRTTLAQQEQTSQSVTKAHHAS